MGCLSSRKSVVDALVAARRSWLTLKGARAPTMDDDDFGDFAASPAPEQPACFAAFDAFSPDTAPSAAVIEAFPPRTQENQAARDQPAAQTMDEAVVDEDDFGDYGEVLVPLSDPVLPPAPAPVSASPADRAADDDFGDFDEATPSRSSAPSPVAERAPQERSAFGDDLVAERSPEMFFEAVDAVLTRAFPEAGTSERGGTDGDGGADAASASIALARRARDAAGGAGLFAGALESCVAGWEPAVTAGIAPPDAARRAALVPKAWDVSPARAALETALRGTPEPPPAGPPAARAAVPAATVPSSRSLSQSPDAPDTSAPLAGRNFEDVVFDVPGASVARGNAANDRVADRVATGAAEVLRGDGDAFGAFGGAEPPAEPFGTFGDFLVSPVADATREEGRDVPSLAVKEAAGPGAAKPKTGSDPEDAFGSFEAAPEVPPPAALRPEQVSSDSFRLREDGEGAHALGDFEGVSADVPGFGGFEEAATAREAPSEPGAPEPGPPPGSSEPALSVPAPAIASPDSGPPEPAATPTTSAADDFADLFGPVQDTKILELGTFEASAGPATPPPPAPGATLPAAGVAEDAFGDFETSPMPSAVDDVVADELGGLGDFAAAPASVDALADLFGDARVVGSPAAAAADKDEFGAFQ